MNIKSFVDFIIPAYNRPDLLKCTLYSLTAQYDPDWTAHVIIDDIENNRFDDIIKSINDKRITYTFLDKRYNDWGHTPREMGKQLSESQYIIMTGDDNYYVPATICNIKRIAAENSLPALIYWNMIHSHSDYHLFICNLYLGGIDMGAFATRNDIAKSVKLSTNYAADGEFIEEVVSLYPNERFVKTDKYLYVHN